MSGTELKRVIGLKTLTLSIVNMIVGSAIFVVPAGAARELGSTAILAYLIAAALVLVVALCFAEAASRVTATGGAYAYVDRAFGPGPGFVVASLQWVANGILAAAAVANALVATLGTVAPVLGSGVPRVVLMGGVFGVLGWINVRGAESGARAVVGFTVLKLAPLLLLLALGLRFVEPTHLLWVDQPTIGSLGRASLLLVFALTGMEIALTPTGEITNPSRTVPLAAVLGVSTTALLYIGMHLMAQGVLGPELARFQAAPLAEVADRVFGPAGRTLLLVAAVVSMLGYLSGDLLATPRALLALASDGLLPAPLVRIHPRYRTPHVAIIGYVVASFGFAVAGSFAQLALLNAIGVLVIYLAVVLSVFKLRRDQVRSDREPLTMPGGPLVPTVAFVMVAVLLGAAPWAQQEAAIGFVAICVIAYLARRRGTRRKTD